MYAQLTALVLQWLRVPPEPQPPHGDPASLQVFRAGRNFYRVKLARWGAAQLLALAGILFWVAIFIDIEVEVHRRHQTETVRTPLNADTFAKSMESVGKQAAAEQKAKHRLPVVAGFAAFKQMLVQLALFVPDWAFPLLWVVKIAGILVYFAQLPVTFAVTRLDFEMRWYMVTDRSLRIRHGIWQVAESTMSFANIQQVVVSQGPLQRLLGLSDVKVQSAGGGGASEHGHAQGEDMHLGLFHSVTNAPQIRDLILDRLRHFREAGLGDPDEKSSSSTPVAAPEKPTLTDGGLLAAAREFGTEVRALRAALQ